MNITLDMVDAIYAQVRRAPGGTVAPAMNQASRLMYGGVIRAMLAGTVFSRSINKAATAHLLRRIAQDDGAAGLLRAVQALDLHIGYYEALGKGSLPGLRAISAAFAAQSRAMQGNG